MITARQFPDYPERIHLPGLTAADVSRETLQTEMISLARRGAVTERDERLMEYLRELNVLSLPQIHRLLWPDDVQQKTVYNRIHRLVKYHIFAGARTPRAEMRAMGLQPGKVYTLGPLGRLWLKQEVDDVFVARFLKRNQVLHDLMVSEVFVRMTERTFILGEQWSLGWAGEYTASLYETGATNTPVPILAPDGLGILRQSIDGTTSSLPFFIEMDAGREAHGRPSSDWGRKIIGYDRWFAANWRTHPALNNLPAFPVVLVITHGKQRLLNLAQAIKQKRKKPVVFYLTLWNDLISADDIFSAPVWLIIDPQGNIIGENTDERRALIVQDPAEV